MDGEPYTVFTPEGSGRETVFHYTMTAISYIVGVNEYAVELTATFYGALGVLLFYIFTKYYTSNEKLRLLISLFFAISSPMVVLGIAGWRLISVVPAVILLLIAIKRYQLKPRLKAAFIIGAAGGLCLYTYHGGRAGALLAIGMFIVIAFLKTKRNDFRTLAASILGLLIVAFPMLIYAVKNYDVWIGRGQSLGIFDNTIAQIFNNFLIALGFFNISGNGADFFTKFPLLEGAVAVLWIVGIVYCIGKYKKYWVELLCFLVMLSPAFLSEPSYHRAVGVLPIVYIFVLIALDKLLKNKILLSIKSETVLTALFTLLVIWQVSASFNKLFVTKEPYLWGFYPETYVVGKYIKDHDPKNIVIYADNFPKDSLILLSKQNNKDYNQSFLNYQRYTTTKPDPIEDLIIDMSKYDPLTKLYVVDKNKIEYFKTKIEELGYAVVKEDTVWLRDEIVAESFRLVKD